MIAKDILRTLLLASAVCAQPDKPRFEPTPICDDCVPRELIIAPGIGIDLTSSYGYFISVTEVHLILSDVDLELQPYDFMTAL